MRTTVDGVEMSRLEFAAISVAILVLMSLCYWLRFKLDDAEQAGRRS